MKNLVKVPMATIRAEASGYFFEPATMRFFDSRLPAHGYRAIDGAVYFYTSEQFHGSFGSAPRYYTVRRLNPVTKSIDTVGEFQAFDTAHAANLEARRLARKEVA
jgi:hypothetical protein